MILHVHSALGDAVRAAARAAFAAELTDVSFQYPPRAELGDLALTAPFDLAKTLRRKPREIAEILAAALTGTPGVRKAEVAGGGYVDSPQVVHPATEDPNARVDFVASRIRGCWHAGGRVPTPGQDKHRVCSDYKRQPTATHRLSGDAPQLDANP